MILEEFDETINSTFDPYEVENVVDGFPKIGVTCFSKRLFDQLVDKFNGIEIALNSNGNGKLPIYKINYEGHEIALFMSRVGASACIVQYEEIFAMGLEKMVVFGTCGVLDKSIDDLAIIIPNSAIRDEGTSYHYLPEGDSIELDATYKDLFIEILKEHDFDYVTGPTWTTDAFYRETRDKVNYFKEKGCLCVEMEASAIAAICKYKNLHSFIFFYAGDNLDSVTWEERSLSGKVNFEKKQEVTLLALDLANKIKK